jgi:hypothetical protein
MTRLAHRRLRAPQEDGAALIDPPLAQVVALIAANRAKLAEFDRRAGFPTGYRATARFELYGQKAWTPQPDEPVIMAGHQPTLFHPGVWLKNFLLSSIAQTVGGRALNMVADTDTIHTANIRVPTLNRGQLTVIDIPFDAASEEIPWEERRIVDHSVFQQFAKQVLKAFESASGRSKGLLIERVWPLAISSAADAQQERVALHREIMEAGLTPPRGFTPDFSYLGEALSGGRHRLERQLGLVTCEYAQRGLGLSLQYFVFVVRLLAEHRQLHCVHNQALAEYRQANHVRSHSHPVPDLVRDGDLFEVPFWIWTLAEPRRRRAFVRSIGGQLELTDRKSVTCRLSDNCIRNPRDFWLESLSSGIKLRPRAVITTMYARLVLSDLFIHGIGGAKYDELTDEIIRRFFGIEPPAYLTATATFRLPIERPPVTAEDVREAARRIRDVRYRPESLLRDPLLDREPAIAQPLAALADEKRNYLTSHRLRRGSRDEFLGLDRLNRAMHDLLRPVEKHLRREQARLIEDARRARLLDSREFSFVLFPEEFLVPRLLELSKVPA